MIKVCAMFGAKPLLKLTLIYHKQDILEVLLNEIVPKHTIRATTTASIWAR